MPVTVLMSTLLWMQRNTKSCRHTGKTQRCQVTEWVTRSQHSQECKDPWWHCFV